jgi:hypothetical protein
MTTDGVELLYPVAIDRRHRSAADGRLRSQHGHLRSRFNNLDNYGGFPAIPSKNPFSTGVF